jgi:tRNA(adenine34) deaminase
MNNEIKHKKFMTEALKQAGIAFKKGEIPVGAVIVREGKIIARAHNQNRAKNNPIKHAEIICIEKSVKKLNNERLTGCELYVTKEPCVMCAGAIVHARIKTIYIGAKDQKYGACGTVLNVCGNKILNHVPEIKFGLFQDESSSLLKDFFQSKRKRSS